MQQTRSPEHDRGGADAAGIEALVKPRSLAVVGATADLSKFGGKLTRNVLGSLGASDGGVENVFLVNPNQRVVQGQETFASLGELPTVPDAVAVAVRADFALSAVRDAVELGSRAIVLVSSGFGEAGPEGAARQALLRDAVTDAGAALIGPNCVGFWNLQAGVNLSTVSDVGVRSHVADDRDRSIAVISQSGSVGIGLLAQHHPAIRYFASTGNEATIDAGALAEALLRSDPQVKHVVLVLEALRDPAPLASAADLAAQRGGRVVVLKLGMTAAARELASLHTGALGGRRLAFEGYCRASGIVLVRTLRTLNGAIAALAAGYGGGRRLGVFTTSGGSTVFAADYATARGVELPQPTPNTRRTLAAELSVDAARVRNPFDTTGHSAFVAELFGRALTAFAADDFDLVLVPLGGAAGDIQRERLTALEAAGRQAKVPVLPVWQLGSRIDDQAAQTLRHGDLSFVTDLESGIDAMVALTAGAEPATDVAQTAAQTGLDPADASTAQTPATLVQSLEFAEELGLHLAAWQRIDSESALVRATAELGLPLILKVSHPAASHKSDHGLVVKCDTDLEARDAYARLLAIADDLGLSDADVIAQCFVGGGLEFMVTAASDVEVGPFIVLGAGGTLVEMMGDAVGISVSDDLAANEQRARDALNELRLGRLASGYRGRAELDVDSLVKLVAKIGQAITTKPYRFALELNPVIVQQQEAHVVDARLLISSPEQGADTAPPRSTADTPDAAVQRPVSAIQSQS